MPPLGTLIEAHTRGARTQVTSPVTNWGCKAPAPARTCLSLSDSSRADLFKSLWCGQTPAAPIPILTEVTVGVRATRVASHEVSPGPAVEHSCDVSFLPPTRWRQSSIRSASRPPTSKSDTPAMALPSPRTSGGFGVKATVGPSSTQKPLATCSATCASSVS